MRVFALARSQLVLSRQGSEEYNSGAPCWRPRARCSQPPTWSWPRAASPDARTDGQPARREALSCFLEMKFDPAIGQDKDRWHFPEQEGANREMPAYTTWVLWFSVPPRKGTTPTKTRVARIRPTDPAPGNLALLGLARKVFAPLPAGMFAPGSEP